MLIHPTAIVDPSAELHDDVVVGPFTVIGPDVKIGSGTVIDGQCWIYERTVIGMDCRLYPGVVIGTPPQDLSYQNEPTRVVIGNRVQIHEYATIHRASGEEMETTVGNGSLLMAYSHLGHNCKIGREVLLANNVHLAGHVQVGDFANIGGSVVVHQFVKIGRLAMIGGFMAVRQDIPPFALCGGTGAALTGLNKIGMKRRGVDLESRSRVKDAFRLLWFARLPQAEAIAQVSNKYPADPLVQELIDFVLTSKRGIRRLSRGIKESLDQPIPEYV